MDGGFLEGTVAPPVGGLPRFSGLVVIPLFAAAVASDARGHPWDIPPGGTQFRRDVFRYKRIKEFCDSFIAIRY